MINDTVFNVYNQNFIAKKIDINQIMPNVFNSVPVLMIP